MDGYMGEASWIDLLNSDWHDYRGSGGREDRLDDPAWLGRFLAPWKGLLDGVLEFRGNFVNDDFGKVGTV
jgi:hypothetical protein